MNIVVIDLNNSGHHEMYMKMYINEFISLGHNITLLNPDPKNIVESISNEKKEFFTYHKIPYFQEKKYKKQIISKYINGILRFKYLADTIKDLNINADIVFFMCLDNILFRAESKILKIIPAKLIYSSFSFMVNRIFPYKWAGLLFVPGIYPKESLKIFNGRQTKGVCIFDGNTILWRDKNNKLVYVPDATTEEIKEDSNLAQEIKRKAGSRKIVLLTGSIEARKSPILLLDIAQILSNRALYFVFIGKMLKNTFDDYDLDRLTYAGSSKIENCFFYFDKIENDAEFNSIINISDIIFAVYPSFIQSSNIITKAALFKKKILVYDYGYVGKIVKEYKLGLCVNSLSFSHVVDSLLQLIELNIPDENFMKLYQTKNLKSLNKKLKLLCSLCEK